VKVLATKGREAIKKLLPEIEFFLTQQQYKLLGESYKRRGQTMHEKAWIYQEIKKAKKAFNGKEVLSSHSFTLREKSVL
jgi:hypothetical protein